MVESNVMEKTAKVKKTKARKNKKVALKNNAVSKKIKVQKTKKTISKSNEETFAQQPLSNYINSLSELLKTAEKVTKHSVLKSEKWTKSCYDLLAKTITDDLIRNLPTELRVQMGTSLSSKTLQKIVTLNYNVSYPIDPRTLNTLNKIVIFLEYKDWDDFIKATDKNLSKTKKKEDVPVKDVLKSIVKEALRLQHLAYCNLPKISESIISKNFIKGSSSYNMIMDTLTDKSSNKQVISNNYNPSTYEILDIKVKKIEDNKAQVYTKEYWLLCWWDTLQNKYVKRFKSIADHYYILQKENSIWKIKTNASSFDPMELEQTQ